MAQKITRRQMLYLAAGGVAALAAGGIIYTWQQTTPAPTQTTTQTQTTAQEANQPRKLAVLARSGYHEEVNKTLMEYYNSKRPPVEFSYTGKGYHDTYQAAVLAMRNRSTDYDVMYLDEPWLYEFYVNGWLEPLGDVDTSGIPQAIADLGKYKGVTYAMPIVGNFNFMFYNKELLDKVGETPPKSWDDVLRIAETVNQKLAPKSYGWSGEYSAVVTNVYATVLLSLGGNLFDPKDRVTPMLDTPEAVEALKIVRDLASPKRAHPKTMSWASLAEYSDAILNGEVAMGTVWNGWVKDVDDPSRSKVVGQIYFMPTPGKRPGSQTGVWYYTVPVFSRNKELAKDYIKVATSYEAQKYAYLKVGLPVTRINIYEEPEVQQKSRLAKMFAEVAKVGMPARTSPIYIKLDRELHSIVNKAVLGELTPEAAAAQMQKLLMEESKKAGLL
jgi:multiple sugar transport system substrate-binding protein